MSLSLCTCFPWKKQAFKGYFLFSCIVQKGTQSSTTMWYMVFIGDTSHILLVLDDGRRERCRLLLGRRKSSHPGSQVKSFFVTTTEAVADAVWTAWRNSIRHVTFYFPWTRHADYWVPTNKVNHRPITVSWTLVKDSSVSSSFSSGVSGSFSHTLT